MRSGVQILRSLNVENYTDYNTTISDASYKKRNLSKQSQPNSFSKILLYCLDLRRLLSSLLLLTHQQQE
jgi:hypothetical protein